MHVGVPSLLCHIVTRNAFTLQELYNYTPAAAVSILVEMTKLCYGIILNSESEQLKV